MRAALRLRAARPGWPSASDYAPRAPPALAAHEAAAFVSRSAFPARAGRAHGAAHAQAPVASRARARGALPAGVALPPYAGARGAQPDGYPEPQVHAPASAARMRAAGALAAEVLAGAGALVVPGASGDDIDDFVHRAALAAGAYPSPLGYMGFPKSVCVSVNEVVCHGIPGGALLRAGDVVSVDVSVFVGGVHGDTCRTWIVGGAAAGDARARELVAATRAALDAAVAACGPGVPVARVGDVIAPLAAAREFSVVESFAGHGIGEVFHTQPIVHHARNASRYVLRPGMTFTIEPMLAEGAADVRMWADGWTVVTADGGRAAQFEHTLLVTEHGVDVLTAYEE